MHDSSASLDPFRCILGDRLSDRGHVQKTDDQVVVEEEGEEEEREGIRLDAFGSGWGGVGGITRSVSVWVDVCQMEKGAPARVATV